MSKNLPEPYRDLEDMNLRDAVQELFRRGVTFLKALFLWPSFLRSHWPPESEKSQAAVKLFTPIFLTLAALLGVWWVKTQPDWLLVAAIPIALLAVASASYLATGLCFFVLVRKEEREEEGGLSTRQEILQHFTRSNQSALDDYEEALVSSFQRALDSFTKLREDLPTELQELYELIRDLKAFRHNLNDIFDKISNEDIRYYEDHGHKQDTEGLPEEVWEDDQLIIEGLENLQEARELTTQALELAEEYFERTRRRLPNVEAVPVDMDDEADFVGQDLPDSQSEEDSD